MAATTSVKPRRCQLTLQGVSLKRTSVMQGRRSKGEGWEISNLISSTVCLTSAARVLLVAEALVLSLFLSQVLFHVSDCKLHERKRDPEPRPGRFVHGGFPYPCEYPLAFSTE